MDKSPDIFAVNVGNDGKVRIIDLIYTAFMRAKEKKGNPDDNGPFDWFNDTYPMMVEQIGKWASELGWQPIETAPNDGTVIDLFCAEGDERYTDCFWGHTEHSCGEAGQYCDSEWHSEQPGWVWGTLNEQISNVTHWMPRPAAPVLTP